MNVFDKFLLLFDLKANKAKCEKLALVPQKQYTAILRHGLY